MQGSGKDEHRCPEEVHAFCPEGSFSLGKQEISSGEGKGVYEEYDVRGVRSGGRKSR